MLTVLMLMGACLTVGCNSAGDEQMNQPTGPGQSSGSTLLAASSNHSSRTDAGQQATLPFTVTLPGGRTLTVTEAYVRDSILTTSFEYVDDRGRLIARTLESHESLRTFRLMDRNGDPLWGYECLETGDGGFLFTASSGGHEMKITTASGDDRDIRIHLSGPEGEESVQFADISELERAGQLGESTGETQADGRAVSAQDRRLAASVGILRDWSSHLTDVALASEIEIVRDLRFDSVLIGSVYGSGGTGADHMPAWEVGCRVVQILKKICEIVNFETICQWVPVLEEICRLLHDIMKDPPLNP